MTDPAPPSAAPETPRQSSGPVPLHRAESLTPPGRPSATLTFAWRALLKIKHTPEQVFDLVATPILFTVLFTYMFGGALAGSPRAYLQFLLPGILVQTVTFTTVYTGVTLNTDLQKGVFDRFRSSPIWGPAPLVGAMAGDVVRYTVSSLIVVTVGLAMGYRPATGVGGVLLSIVLLDVFAFGIGWVFTAVALLVRTPATVMALSWLVLMPLTFGSNIYVDPSTMPPWLQTAVAVNPVTLVTTAVRGILAGTVTAGQVGWGLLAPGFVAAICGPVAMRLYQRER